MSTETNADITLRYLDWALTMLGRRATDAEVRAFLLGVTAGKVLDRATPAGDVYGQVQEAGGFMRAFGAVRRRVGRPVPAERGPIQRAESVLRRLTTPRPSSESADDLYRRAATRLAHLHVDREPDELLREGLEDLDRSFIWVSAEARSVFAQTFLLRK